MQSEGNIFRVLGLYGKEVVVSNGNFIHYKYLDLEAVLKKYSTNNYKNIKNGYNSLKI